jgi:hypothetical protein
MVLNLPLLLQQEPSLKPKVLATASLPCWLGINRLFHIKMGKAYKKHEVWERASFDKDKQTLPCHAFDLMTGWAKSAAWNTQGNLLLEVTANVSIIAVAFLTNKLIN